jgi:hypothetical protein
VRDLNDAGAGFGWITALRAHAIGKLARDDGPLQMSLFDTQDLAEITHPDHTGERLIACRNPALADEHARKRDDLLAATGKLLTPIVDRVAAGRLTGADNIGIAVGKVIDKYQVGKHFRTTITDTSLGFPRDQTRIDTKPSPTASTCCAPACPRPTLTRPRWCPATRTSPASNATSASSRSTTRTAPDPALTRGPRQSPRADLPARLPPRLAPPQSLGASDSHRRAPTAAG